MSADPILPPNPRFFHTGDLGDIIACLPIVRKLGGGEFVIGDVPMRLGHGRRQSMAGERFDSIKKLLEVQPYIRNVVWEERCKLHHYDFSTFRTMRNFHGSTICDWQARYLRVKDVDMSPWLAVDPCPESKGRVVVARSSRYHEDEFPWRSIIQSIGNRSLFVGLPEEHQAFQEYVGATIERRETPSLLDVARTIKGADLTIVNQTSTFWVAAGLGAPLIQEVCRRAVDSIVPRPNARYPMSAFDYNEVAESFK